MRDNNRVVMFRRVSTFLLALGLAGVAQATEAPVAVSPGEASRLALVEGRCPTFSWGAVLGAKRYELLVYRLGEEGEEAPVLEETFSGAVSGWTPSLERCLERGGRYAWSVRAIGTREESEWSQPNLFEVASGPTEAAFEEALEVVRQFLSEGGAVPIGITEAEPQSRREASASSLAAPAAGVVATTELNVDGGIEATSFLGDGSQLTSLTAENLAPGTAAIDISGTAANVTATVAVANGGTGATDAAGALANLGGAAAADLTSHAGLTNAHHPPPMTLPPSGSAGGDLTGSYPNPTIGTNAVGSAEIENASVAAEDLAFDPATQAELDALSITGEIRMYAGQHAPPGWAFCDGNILLIAGHEALFSVIGTLYGGDGRTTFGLPDLRGRVPMGVGAAPGMMNRILGNKPGAETVILDVTQLPSHSHTLRATNLDANLILAEGHVLARTPPAAPGYRLESTSVEMAADSIGSTGSNGAHANIQPSLVLNFIIKIE